MTFRCAYGWERDRDRERRTREEHAGIEARALLWLRPVPSEQETIREIVELHAQGLGCRRIARALAAKGLTFRGRRWTHTDVARVLRRAGVAPHPPRSARNEV